MKKEKFDTIEKAKKLRDQFEQLSYSEKLRFMDEHFGGVSAVEDEEGIIISIEPNGPDEMKLFNKRFERNVKRSKFGRDLFLDNLQDECEQRINNYIKIHKYPKPYIKEYLLEQLNIYQDNIKNYNLNLIKKWDLSKQIIDLDYLRIQAWPEYADFLEGRLNELERKGIKTQKPDKHCPSEVRAIAFCIIEMFNIPEYKDMKYCKKCIFDLAEYYFPAPPSAAKIYDAVRLMREWQEELKKKFILDYEHGMKLFRELFPDY